MPLIQKKESGANSPEVISINDDSADDTITQSPMRGQWKRKRQLTKRIEVINLFEDTDEGSDDDVEIVSPPKPPKPIIETFDEPCRRITRSSKRDRNTSEIMAIGSANVLKLPHLRQDCTEFSFTTKQKKYCRLCYCYICDIPVSTCTDWSKHCSATNKGKEAPKWKKMREKRKLRKSKGN